MSLGQSKSTLEISQRQELPNLKLMIEQFNKVMKADKQNQKFINKIRKLHSKFVLQSQETHQNVKTKQLYNDLKNHFTAF